MDNITKDYSPKANFWEFYPAFCSVEPFGKLYRSDKTSGKSGSSAKMWAIALLCHPKSDFYYLEGKEDKIASGMKKQHGIDIIWDELKDHIDSFVSMTVDQARKSLIAWEKRLKERDEFLEQQKWTLDYYDEQGKLCKGTADQLDRMHGTTHKHYKEYELIVKEIQELESKEQSKRRNVEELDV